MKLQTIEINGAPCAIVPIRDYDQLRGALEDAADREALRQSRTGGEELGPDALVDRLAARPVFSTDIIRGPRRSRISRNFRFQESTERIPEPRPSSLFDRPRWIGPRLVSKRYSCAAHPGVEPVCER